MTEETGTAGAGAAGQHDDDAVALAHTLFQAASEGNDGMLGAYLGAGAPATLTNAAGDSLLMLAAYHGHAETVSALVAAGADPDLRNGQDQSPLAGALFKGADEVVKVLRAAGADLEAGTPTAREAAVLFGRQHLLEEGDG